MTRNEKIYIPNPDFPNPDFPKRIGKLLEQSVTNSQQQILRNFHGEDAIGYPMTSSAQLFGSQLFEKMEGDIDSATLQEIVWRVFVRCGVEQRGDNQHTTRGNSTKSTPLSNRKKVYPLPKYSIEKTALQYLYRVVAVVRKEIAAERSALMSTASKKEDAS